MRVGVCAKRAESLLSKPEALQPIEPVATAPSGGRLAQELKLRLCAVTPGALAHPCHSLDFRSGPSDVQFGLAQLKMLGPLLLYCIHRFSNFQSSYEETALESW